jgi:hypothetical protein
MVVVPSLIIQVFTKIPSLNNSSPFKIISPILISASPKFQLASVKFNPLKLLERFSYVGGS